MHPCSVLGCWSLVRYSGSQQQFFTRNSELAQWEGGVWNMVFVGTKGVPASGGPASSS